MEFKEKISKYNYLQLKQILYNHIALGKGLRESAVKNNGDTKQFLYNLKKQYGQDTRLYFLLLGFLKGRRYLDIESKVAPWNRLDRDEFRDFIVTFIDRKYWLKKQFDEDLDLFFKDANVIEHKDSNVVERKAICSSKEKPQAGRKTGAMWSWMFSIFSRK